MKHVRLLVLVLVSVFSLVLGLCSRSWWDIGAVLDYAGYWTVAALVVLWLFMALALLRAQVRSLWSLLGWKGLAWVTVAWFFLISREPTEFKVLMDEPMLVFASQGMHYQRSATAPLRSYEIGGVKEYLGGFQDKRPLLFPFLLSLVHDATGYRVENIFWLNKAMVLGLLFVAWMAGRKLDPKFGGVLMMLWLCGWPILAQNACGGGFEILNLALVIIVFAAATQFLSRGDDKTEAFLLSSCMLLAHTRYESVLYMLVFAGIWLVNAIMKHRWTLSWFTALSPLLLITILWQRKIVSANGSIWQLRKGNDHPFSTDFIPANSKHALRFLLEPNADMAGSPLFGALGLLALMGLGFCLFRAIKKHTEPDFRLKALGWVAGIVFLSFGVLLSYHWGQLDDPLVSRLALPLIGVMGLAGCASRPLLLPTAQTGRLLIGVMAFWIIGYAMPVMNQHRYSQNNIHATIFRWARQEITAVGCRSPLVISYQQIMWLIYGTQSLSLPEAASRMTQIEFHRGVQTYDVVFVIQSFMDDPATRQKIPLKGNRFVDGVALETLAEKSFYPFNLIRISRVKSIDLDRVSKDKTAQEDFEVFHSASPADLQGWRDLLP